MTKFCSLCGIRRWIWKVSAGHWVPCPDCNPDGAVPLQGK